jgi:hypothetical protein
VSELDCRLAVWQVTRRFQGEYEDGILRVRNGDILDICDENVGGVERANMEWDGGRCTLAL